MSKVDSMTPNEQMRYWMDVVEGKVKLEEGYEVANVEEKENPRSVIITLKKMMVE